MNDTIKSSYYLFHVLTQIFKENLTNPKSLNLLPHFKINAPFPKHPLHNIRHHNPQLQFLRNYSQFSCHGGLLMARRKGKKAIAWKEPSFWWFDSRPCRLLATGSHFLSRSSIIRHDPSCSPIEWNSHVSSGKPWDRVYGHVLEE